MRWLVCTLLLPLSASAASVLLIPVNEKARVLAYELIEPFAAQNLTVKMAGAGSPAANCLKVAARDACLGNIGEKAKVVAVFVVSGALKRGKANLTLEMLFKGAVVKKDSTRVNKRKVKSQMKKPIAALLELLSLGEQPALPKQPKVTVTSTPKDPEALPDLPRANPSETDAPKKTNTAALTPSQPVDPLALETPTLAPAKAKVAAWVVTGLAIAAAGTAATFGGLGLSGKSRLESAQDGVSPLSYNEAVALQQTSNTQLTVALGTGIGAGVTGVVAAILWGVD